MRPLTILSVAYPLAPVGPDAVGGSEQVLSALDHALVAAGHRSLVVASAGSVVAGELLPIPALPTGRTLGHEDAELRLAAIRTRMDEALATRDVDVVHMHGLDFYKYLPPPGPPVLATLHLPPDWYPPEALAPSRPDTWVNCVSASQAERMPPGAGRIVPPITNGVAVRQLGAVRPRVEPYALMLARVCPEKGLHLALEAAHAAQRSLVIAGAVFPYKDHLDYFEERVRPLLDRRRRWVGPVGFTQKRRLLAAARCLVVPSLVPETSSLVAMEAASCGTPVVAFRIGALPEVVEHGRTGLIVDDLAGLVAALDAVGSIDRALCRAVAAQRFSHEQMAAAYIAQYRQLARSPALRNAA